MKRLALLLAGMHALLMAAAVLALAAAEVSGAAIAAVAAALGAAGLVSMAAVAFYLRPLARFQEAALGVARGDLGQRLDSRRAGGLAGLAEAFNRMAESVEEFVASASRERNRLTAALNSSSDAVVAVDGDGRIAYANAAAERLFSRPQGEIAGEPFVWALPDERVQAALRASREEGRRESCLIERPHQQYLQVATTPIVGGGEWAALVVVHDLTEARRLEQVRRDFVANVSHELRTPLAGIKSVIETLQEGAWDDARAAREFLSRADAEVDRLVQLVEELLELSLIESGEVPLAGEPVDLRGVLGDAVERLRAQAAKRGVSLTLETPPELPAVTGDRERLEQAAVNLVHNALKFTPAGGAVLVSADVRDGTVTVSVRDTGVGIAPEHLPRIFERFYKAERARGSGTGLGLAVVKHTVEAHGGTVSVESEPGEGSTFSFSIPAAPPDGAETRGGAAQA